MEKINKLTPKYVEQMPKEKEHGILYISKKFGLAIHLCACGCGVETVTPLKGLSHPIHGGWDFKDENGKVTLRPSIGNFNGERPYHAHYFITENNINWL